MKKNAFVFLVLSIFFSLSVSAKLVEIKDAKQAGITFYFQRLTNNLHQAVPYSSITIKDEFVEKTDGLPVYYIFNFAGNGYIIVSADDACYPILGYSFESSYSPENVPENFTFWLSNYKFEINSVREKNLKSDAAINKEWSQLLKKGPVYSDHPVATRDVEPLIRSMWNQDFPYNGMCPKDPASTGSYFGRVPSGCVATAMSQIMHYWRYPAQGQGSHCISPIQSNYGQQCANFGETTYDWNGMPDETNLESNALALLAWHCGISVDMQYGPDGSGTATSKVPYALKTYFKYANTVQHKLRYSNYQSWLTLLKGDIDAGKPIEYSGDNNVVGHAFVLDGYQQVGSDYMFHFNWGWGGTANGYFYINNLNPNGSNFNLNQAAVVHIAPDPSFYPSYCAGNVNVTATLGSVEDGSGPVADYQNNANCSWLIAPDDSVHTITLSFTDFNTATEDIVNVYDGIDATAPLLGTFSGNLTSMPSVTSTGPSMFITFITNGSGTAPGWKANYSTTFIKFCNMTTNLLEAWGHIDDGSGRFSYRNLSTCKWFITPPGASKLIITPNNFNTEPDQDKLMIYDIGTGDLLATLSGNYTTPPAPISSTTGSVMLIWQTNNSVRGAGWDLDYSPVVGTEEKTAFKDLTFYPNPADEEVTIRYSMPEAIRITFRITDLTGKLLKNCSSIAQPGENIQKIDISTVKPGIYFLQVITDQAIQNSKLIIN